MHVPKPRNEILTSGIDDAGVFRRLDVCGIRNGGDVIAGDDHGPISLNR